MAILKLRGRLQSLKNIYFKKYGKTWRGPNLFVKRWHHPVKYTWPIFRNQACLHLSHRQRRREPRLWQAKLEQDLDQHLSRQVWICCSPLILAILQKKLGNLDLLQRKISFKYCIKEPFFLKKGVSVLGMNINILKWTASISRKKCQLAQWN